MWKPPTRREYRPKPLDPGQPVQWQHEIPGRWTGPSWGSGEWIPGERVTRTGTVWSAGPVPSSLWVIPDDSREPVAVKLPSPRDRERGCGLASIASYPASWARDAVRRAENVRRHGSIFAVIDRSYETWTGYTYSQRREIRHELSWHCDPSCPDAAGKERDPERETWPVRDVIAILIGERHPAVSPRFCNRCIYLSEPAEVAAA